MESHNILNYKNIVTNLTFHFVHLILYFIVELLWKTRPCGLGQRFMAVDNFKSGLALV